MQYVLSASHISKSFGSLKVLDDINFKVSANELFGIIGADGAGKSKLFRIFTTLILADSGKCNVAGLDVVKDYVKIREIVGYMPGNFSLYTDLSVEENLTFFAHIFNTSIEEHYDLIKNIYRALEPFKTRKAGALSGGMKQKLALCCTLIHKPQILFLDEPTTGVDVVSRQEFWDILQELKSQMSIIVSTPYMDEANLCDTIAFMSNGKILSLDTPQNICEHFPYRIFECKNISPNELMRIRQCDFVYSSFLFGQSYHIVFKEHIPLEQILKLEPFNKADIKEIKATIEDCFMELL